MLYDRDRPPPRRPLTSTSEFNLRLWDSAPLGTADSRPALAVDQLLHKHKPVRVPPYVPDAAHALIAGEVGEVFGFAFERRNSTSNQGTAATSKVSAQGVLAGNLQTRSLAL